MRRRRLVVTGALIVALAAAAVVWSQGGSPEAAGTGAGGADELSVSATGWRTDFSRHSVPLGEFVAGGPPRDGIPPIDAPRFSRAAGAPGSAREPVVAVETGGRAKAYPIRILIWHEIVNDELAGRPIAVTFCPLCNTSIVFARTVAGRSLRFGTTGNLRASDLVMWDDATQSWWQQFTGDAVVGDLTGSRLERLPSRVVSLGRFRREHPDGEVLTEQTGHRRPYGRNPYVGYDDVRSPPFLLPGRPPDGRLAPKERVVSIGRAQVAVPFAALRQAGVVETDVGDIPVSVWWIDGVASPLDTPDIAAGREVGSASVVDRRLDGRVLSFTRRRGEVRDEQTGTAWGSDGTGLSGPLAGRRLRPVLHDTPFWFAVAAFRPDVRIVRRSGR